MRKQSSVSSQLDCHSGLSGIGCFSDIMEKKGSGQAGMTPVYKLVKIAHILLLNAQNRMGE